MDHPPTSAVLIGRANSTVPIVGHLPQSEESASVIEGYHGRAACGLKCVARRKLKIADLCLVNKEQQPSAGWQLGNATHSVTDLSLSHWGSGPILSKIGDFSVKSQMFLSYRNPLLARVFSTYTHTYTSLDVDLNLFQGSGTIAHGITQKYVIIRHVSCLIFQIY